MAVNLFSFLYFFYSDKHRKAWIVPACLSTSTHSMNLQFRALNNVGSIMDGKSHPGDNQLQRNHYNQDHLMNVNCLPLTSILYAMNRYRWS